MSTTNENVKSQTGPVFSVHSIYTKDVSFEAPHTPQIFTEEWQHSVDFDLQMGSEPLPEKEGLYEVVLHITLTVKLKKEDKTAFLIDLKQAGVFTIFGFDEEVTKELLGTECPRTLFAYARAEVSGLVQRGGFPSFVLPPINFDAVYAQHKLQAPNQTQKETILN